MSSFKKLWALGLVAGLLAATALMGQSFGGERGEGPAWAQVGERQGPRGHVRAHRGMARIFRQLDLSDSQKEQMKQIGEAFRQQSQPLREELFNSRRELRRSLLDGTFDQAYASQRLADLSQVEAQLMADRYQMHQEFLSILTPDQRGKLEEIKESHRSRREQ